ncbi:hypothetical protein G7046_g8077 [Stylonectria norvegica]|nr:hypothetical protein G7046_g8077 [Stylonectria norvegica]
MGPTQKSQTGPERYVRMSCLPSKRGPPELDPESPVPVNHIELFQLQRGYVPSVSDEVLVEIPLTNIPTAELRIYFHSSLEATEPKRLRPLDFTRVCFTDGCHYNFLSREYNVTRWDRHYVLLPTRLDDFGLNGHQVKVKFGNGGDTTQYEGDGPYYYVRHFDPKTIQFGPPHGYTTCLVLSFEVDAIKPEVVPPPERVSSVRPGFIPLDSTEWFDSLRIDISQDGEVNSVGLSIRFVERLEKDATVPELVQPRIFDICDITEGGMSASASLDGSVISHFYHVKLRPLSITTLEELFCGGAEPWPHIEEEGLDM